MYNISSLRYEELNPELIIMEVQFLDLLVKDGRKKVVDLSLNIEPLEFDGDIIKAIKPVVVKGEMVSREGIIELEANIKTDLELNCSRCLDTFIYPIDIDIEERFTNNKELENEEGIIFVDGDSLDLSLIVENSIISTLPIKRLCKEDCKGLCSNCGANLNAESCNCNNFDVDIRLAKLRELFGE